MKQLFLVSDQKAMIKAFPTFQESKEAFDQMCANHIKQMADNPTFRYRRNFVKLEDAKINQFVSSYKTVVKGKPRFIQDVFSFQVLTIND